MFKQNMLKKKRNEQKIKVCKYIINHLAPLK